MESMPADLVGYRKSNKRFLWKKGRFFMEFRNHTELVFEIKPLNVQGFKEK